MCAPTHTCQIIHKRMKYWERGRERAEENTDRPERTKRQYSTRLQCPTWGLPITTERRDLTYVPTYIRSRLPYRSHLSRTTLLATHPQPQNKHLSSDQYCLVGNPSVQSARKIRAQQTRISVYSSLRVLIKREAPLSTAELLKPSVRRNLISVEIKEHCLV